MRIIFISGKIGSGKDTTASIVSRLVQQKGYNPVQLHFAQPLKQAVAFMRGENVGLYYNRNAKDGDAETTNARRQMLVNVGAAMTTIDPHVFAKFLINAAKTECRSTKKAVFIVSDLRFKKELQYCIGNSNHYIIRLKGSFKPSKDETILTSKSEIDLDYLDEFKPVEFDYYGSSLAVLQLEPTDNEVAPGLTAKEIQDNKVRNALCISQAVDTAFNGFEI